MKYPRRTIDWTTPTDAEIDVLLHPAQAFDQPGDVVDDPDLTLNEKRAILASWVSDACAVEAAPALRRVPGSGRVVSVDEILEALRTLDKQAGENGSSWARRQVRRASIEAFRESRNRCEDGTVRELPHLGGQSAADQRRTNTASQILNGCTSVLNSCSVSASKEAFS